MGQPNNSSLSSFAAGGQMNRLVRLAQDGDRVAVGELLETYRCYLRTIARRRMSGALAGRVDPSDLVQQTMLEAHQGLRNILTDDRDHLRARLRKILTCNVANAIRDHLVSEKRAVGRECGDCEEVGRQPGRLTSPSMTMAKREMFQRFADSVDQLPEDQATAIRMRYFESASVGEIAATLGRSRTAAAGLLKRGLAELRKLIPPDAS